jgi:L-threonylcarbamoyladenylate synthase
MTILPISDEAIENAGARLRAGGLVAFPTETVYGLGADATVARAVAAIYATKRRPSFNPLIVHVSDLAEADRLAPIDAEARRLAETFWPGALTLVLPRRKDCAIAHLVSAGLDTLAMRVPAHPVARKLLAAARRPLAAPSANRSGHVSPTEARHVADDFADEDLPILNGGACALGLESTVVGWRGGLPVLLRPGAIEREAIERALGRELSLPQAAARPDSPGQLESHYAPRALLRLNAASAQDGEALLTFGPEAPDGAFNLSPSGDLREAAAHLFAALRAIDAGGARRIAVTPIPETGLGEAINDRLRRAAAPRD